MRCRVRERTPRLLASSASLDPSSSTALSMRESGSSEASSLPRLSSRRSPSRSPIRGVSKSDGSFHGGTVCGSGSSSVWPGAGSGHGPAGVGSPVAAAKKEARRLPARTAQARSWLVEEVSVTGVRSRRRERPRLT